MWLERLGNVDEIILYIFAAAAAINLVLALAVLIVGCCYRTSVPGSSMDTTIVLGGMLLVASVLLGGIQVKDLTQDILDAICQFHPALVTFGLLWLIGGLLMKASAIFHYYRRNDTKQVSRSECLPHVWLLFFMVIDVVIMLIWALKYTPRSDLNPDENDSEYICGGEKRSLFYLIITAIHGVLLFLSAIIVWFAMHMARKSTASYESTLLSVIVYNTLFVAIAATVIYFFGYLKFNSSMRYAIIGGLMIYAVFAAFLFLLIGKAVTAKREQAARDEPGVYDQVDHNKGYD